MGDTERKEVNWNLEDKQDWPILRASERQSLPYLTFRLCFTLKTLLSHSLSPPVPSLKGPSLDFPSPEHGHEDVELVFPENSSPLGLLLIQM